MNPQLDNHRTGIWQGITAFGCTTMVIDEDSDAYGFSDDSDGRYRSILCNLNQLYGELGHQQLYNFYFTPGSDDHHSPEDSSRRSDVERTLRLCSMQWVRIIRKCKTIVRIDVSNGTH